MMCVWREWRRGAEDWCNLATHVAQGIRMARNPWLPRFEYNCTAQYTVSLTYSDTLPLVHSLGLSL